MATVAHNALVLPSVPEPVMFTRAPFQVEPPLTASPCELLAFDAKARPPHTTRTRIASLTRRMTTPPDQQLSTHRRNASADLLTRRRTGHRSWRTAGAPGSERRQERYGIDTSFPVGLSAR